MIHELVHGWVMWMRAGGAPETTIAQRRYQVVRTLRDAQADPLTVTAEQLIEWLGSQAWAPETRRAYRAGLRRFFTWLQATGRRADNPAALIPTVPLPRTSPRPTPDSIYREALAGADDDTRLMLRLAAMLGLRRGEIAKLHSSDLLEDLVGTSLRVHGKGGHVRTLPLPEVLAAALRLRTPGWVFPSPSARRPGAPLTPAHVGVMVSRALPDGWTCHTLRHRCATVAYAAERDLRAVQELLGHAKPETTARYTQVPNDAIRRAIAAAAA